LNRNVFVKQNHVHEALKETLVESFVLTASAIRSVDVPLGKVMVLACHLYESEPSKHVLSDDVFDLIEQLNSDHLLGPKVQQNHLKRHHQVALLDHHVDVVWVRVQDGI
jgi:hypothetical protein